MNARCVELTCPPTLCSSQRRIVAPSFALVHIKALVPTFLDKAQQLVQLIDLHLTNTPDKEVDMKLYSAKCTFDIIGAAG